MRFPVVIIIDSESAEEKPPTSGERHDVAVLLPGRDREVAESLLLVVVEAEGLGDNSGGAAGEVAVGEPLGGEDVGGVGRSAAVQME